MALPPIRTDADAYGVWFLQPTGCDPGDALSLSTAPSEAERRGFVQRGFKMLSQAQGSLGDPDFPLQIRPPTLESCREVLKELRGRAPRERDKLSDLLVEAQATARDMGVPQDERQIARERIRGLQDKLIETYRILAPTAKERKEDEAEVKRLKAVASDSTQLDEDRREARDAARELERKLRAVEGLRPYTPEMLRRYFLFCYRIQLENLIPKPHYEIQQRIAQIQALRREEDELTLTIMQQVDGEAAEVEAELANA